MVSNWEVGKEYTRNDGKTGVFIGSYTDEKGDKRLAFFGQLTGPNHYGLQSRDENGCTAWPLASAFNYKNPLVMTNEERTALRKLFVLRGKAGIVWQLDHPDKQHIGDAGWKEVETCLTILREYKHG